MATPSGRVSPLVVQLAGACRRGPCPRQARCRAQCGHEAEEKSHQAGGRHEGGDQLVAPAPCRGGPQDQHPGDPAQPARDWAEDDQPRRPRVPAAAARGRCACLGGDGSGVPDPVQEGPDTRCVVGIEPGPPLFDVPVHFGEDLVPAGGVYAPQRCVQLRQIAPDELVGLAGGFWRSLLAPFVEDLLDGVAEKPPLFLEAGEG